MSGQPPPPPTDPPSSPSSAPGPATQVCYRHPDRHAPLSCTRCGRPICLDDAIDAPVGFLCPEDAEQPERVRRAARSVAMATGGYVTRGLVGVIAVVYVAQQVVPGLVQWGGLIGLGRLPSGELVGVGVGEWWRLVTSGFLHGSLIHVGFNGYLLWQLGGLMESAMKPSRYVATFVAGLLGGSAGALLLTYNSLTIGASGAVFGLMGAAMVGLRARGINPWSTSIGSLLLLNIAFTFIGGNISIGGHLGGLLGGFLAGLVVFRAPESIRTSGAWGVAAAAGVLAVLIGANAWTTGIGL
jgi:membrane associated rhomboid family serine protease